MCLGEQLINSELLLRVLIISEIGSVKRASTELNIAQPALSRSVKLLEDQLGISIFERSTKGVVLTHAGEQLMAHARLIRASLKDAEGEIHAKRSAGKRTLAFGVPPIHALELFTASLLQTRAQFPDLLLRIDVEPMDVLKHMLLQGKIDFIFGPVLQSDAPENVRQEILFYEDLCIVCGPRNPLFHRENVSLEELMQQQWVLGPSGSSSRMRMEEFCSLQHVDTPKIAIEIDAVAARRELVMQSEYLTIAQRGIFSRTSMYRDLSAIPFDWQQLNRPIGIMSLAGSRPSQFLRDYMRNIKERAEGLRL